MGKINATVTIAAPPEKVWEQLSTPAHYEQWLTIHTKWKGHVPETFAPGATASEVVTMLGMPNTITWTVQELEAPSKLTISGEGMAGVRTTFGLSVASDGNGGSTADIDAEFEGQMITGALGQAVERDAKQQLDASLAKLAALLG
ncbi:MAG: SRPBCC family protein [Solirubrobacteraceae bacterium]